jgi:hypothetical protein
MSILNFLAQIMSGNIQVDPETKSQIANAMSGQPAAATPIGQAMATTAPATAAPRVTPGGVAKRGGGTSPLVNAMDMPEDVPALPAPVSVATVPEPSPELADQPASPLAAAMNPTDQRLAAGTQQSPMSPVQQGGVLSRAGSYLNQQFGFDQPDFLSRFGTALAIAGSQDPTKALMQLQQNRSEQAKIEEARRQRMMPKIVGSAGPNGAIQLVQMPDGNIVPKTLDQVMEMNKAMKATDFASDVQKAILVEKAKDEIKTGAEARKREADSSGERVQAGLNVQQLNQIADSLEKTDTATGPVIGLLPKWARDIVTPQGASLQDAAERIVQGGLRATLGGQFTQVEGDRFLARAYNPRLDEKQNAANLRTIAREIAAMQLDKDNALTYFKQNGTLEGFVPNANAQTPAAASPAQSGPPASDQLRAAVTAAGIPFEPEKFQYRIGPNGQVQRKAK